MLKVSRILLGSSSAELMRDLKRDGWTEERQRGSHVTFDKPPHQHIVTVPHPKKDLGRGLELKIRKEMDCSDRDPRIHMLKVSRILCAFEDKDIASHVPPQMIKLLDKLNGFGEFYLVGGCIRDILLGRKPKDFDIMVVKPSPSELEKILPVKQVGAAFPVYLYDSGDPEIGTIEFAYARKEMKQGEGYKGFAVEVVDNVQEDLARRDLTVNNIAWSPKTGLVTFGPESLEDMESKTLRHVTDAFADDPVRVLRACRFSAQLPGSWKIDSKTLTMMASLKGELLKEPSDRIRDELTKVLKAAKPGNFFRNLEKADCLDGWFSELVGRVDPLANQLDACAKNLDTLSMYCIIAQFMDSDASVASFCKRIVLGSGDERAMQQWLSITRSPMASPQDYMRVYEAGRRGLLTYEHIFKLLGTIGKESLIPTLKRVISAVNSLDLASVAVKSEIPSMKLKVVADQI